MNRWNIIEIRRTSIYMIGNHLWNLTEMRQNNINVYQNVCKQKHRKASVFCVHLWIFYVHLWNVTDTRQQTKTYPAMSVK